MDERTRKTIARMIGVVCVAAVAVFAAGQTPPVGGPGDCVAVITAGQPHSGALLLISGGLLFLVRRKGR